MWTIERPDDVASANEVDFIWANRFEYINDRRSRTSLICVYASHPLRIEPSSSTA